MQNFVPARGKLEAVSRLSALTGSPPEALGPGSKERKSALTNLATALNLNVDPTAPKPDLGSQIASELGLRWGEDCWSAGQTITLHGLNRLLQGAESHVSAQRRAPQLELFESVQRVDAAFVPARSKIEAVTRVSALTGSPPETLGPGSKERKSVLVNLAVGLDLSVDQSATKPVLGGSIAAALDVEWDQTCWSTGATVTLEGLNRLLRGAEAALAARGRSQPGLFFSAQEEGRALLSALQELLPVDWDGRDCVQQMREGEYSQWAQDEWAAFFFEFVGLPGLINTFGGGPRTYANTRFDYGLGHTWDLKVHMATTGVAPLNDCAAVDEALAAGGGVGFLVLTGDVGYDEGEFRAWQRHYRARHGKRPRARTTPATYVRKSKPRFTPRMLEAFYLPDSAAKEKALARGALGMMRQGVQTGGQARRPKYSINLVRARMDDDLLLSQIVL